MDEAHFQNQFVSLAMQEILEPFCRNSPPDTLIGMEESNWSSHGKIKMHHILTRP